MEKLEVKRVLITGKNSYIGQSLINWVHDNKLPIEFESIDLRDPSWKLKSFSGYDSIFHVAGIAHIKESKKNRDLYFNVNRDLAYDVAKKAKNDGVKQFIFLSSMSVYGMETGIIKQDTKPTPKTAYGKSKYEAERLIQGLQDSNFNVVILRPPMVYGPKSKGNYQFLSSFARRSFIFPKFENKRSMIFINNLSSFVKDLIENNESGLFFPQDGDYVNVSEMVQLINEVNDKKIIFTKIFNPFIKLLTKIAPFNKVFGDLYYEAGDYTYNIHTHTLRDSIKITEQGNKN